MWEKAGRGRKRNWKEADIEYVEMCLEKEQRTYNAAQLSQKLAQERGVTLSSGQRSCAFGDRLRKVLKKRGGVVKEPGINNLLLPTRN
ncbi:MAG: hypothetical protein AB4038_19270 [Prochloraceae cyanobacterium]